MSSKPLLLPVRIWRYVEDAVLVLAFLILIVLSAAQVVMRNFLGIGLDWGDTFLRFLVLWLTMLGAMVATREDRQITVDVISHIFPPRVQATIRIFTDLFAAGLCSILAYASVLFIVEEKQGGAMAFASIPTWIAETILPFGFMVIAIRYFLFAGIHSYQAVTGKLPSPEESEEAAS